MPQANGLYYTESDLRPSFGGNPYPVILVHGAGGTHLHWPPQIRRLRGQWTLAVDLPGHGRSQGVGEQEVAAYAERLVAWAEAVGFSKALWVGHSMGGAIVLALALEHPEKVQALGLVATGSRLPVNPRLLESTAQPETFPLAVETIMKWAFSRGTSSRLRQQAAQRMLEVRSTVLHNDFAACDRFDVDARLERLGVPVMVVHGTADKMTPFHYGEHLAAAIPHARLVAVRDAGHMVMLEQPDAVAEALAAFAAEVLAGG